MEYLTPHQVNLTLTNQLYTNTSQTNTQDIVRFSTSNHHDNNTISQFTHSHSNDRSDNKHLPSLLKDLNVITSPAEVNHPTVVKLVNADIDNQTNNQ